MQDGNITCNVGNVSASDKDRRHRSALSAASYQSGEVLFSNKKNRSVDAREAGDGDVQFTQIIAPDGAPKWVFDRNTLWNTVERDAYRKDNRLAKKIMVALPREIPDNLRVNLLLDYIKPYVAWGAVADIAIHNDPEDHNPHAHILLTTHKLKPDGFLGKGFKITGLDERRFVNNARKDWAELLNLYLEKVGSSLRVDHRSYKARGIGVEPTRHRGPHFQETELNLTEPIKSREHGHGSGAEPVEQQGRQVKEKTPEQTEDVMTKPTAEELKHYPHLAQQDTWPPAREAAPDMTRQERDEHHRYWQDQDNAEIQHLANDFYGEHQQDYLQAEREHTASLKSPEPEADEYAFAINKAKQERGWITDQQREYVEDMVMDRQVRERHQQEQNALYKRAIDMKPTRAEVELRDMANTMTPERKQAVHSYIISKRMERLQVADNQARKDELDKHLQVFEKKKLQEFAEAEIEVDKDRYPVPGPNGEPIAQSQLEQAQEAMRAELEREWNVPTTEQDQNEWQRMGRARDEMMEEFEKEQERERER